MHYFNSPMGYISASLFAGFVNFIFVKDIFVIGSFSFSNFFSLIPWVFMIFIPAISMRLFSEERRNKTLEVLISLPLLEREIVLGKFLAAFLVISVGLLLTMFVPITFFFIVKIYLPEVLVGYSGVLLLAAAFLSFSIFVSGRTNSQIVAFLVSSLFLFLFLVFSSDFASTVVPESLLRYINFLLPLIHYNNFAKGVIDLSSVVYFLSATAMFLFLTVIDLEKRR